MNGFPLSMANPAVYPGPPPAETDVVVIGGGVIGVCTALYLARGGQRVTLLEKGRVAGEQSSRNWGWIRQQGRDPDELPIMVEALARWREETAQARNRARGFVVSDAGLLELARLRPTTPSDIQVVGNIHPRALQRYQPDLLQAIATAAGDRSAIYRPRPLDNGQRQDLNRMQEAVKARAGELDVDPALLASRREIERLLRAVAAGKPPPERFLGWRKQVITDELMGIIS